MEAPWLLIVTDGLSFWHQLGPEVLPPRENQTPGRQVGYYFVLQPVVQGKKHGNQNDLDAQHLQGFAIGPVVDLVISHEDDEFKKQDKGKETHYFDRSFRNPEH